MLLAMSVLAAACSDTSTKSDATTSVVKSSTTTASGCSVPDASEPVTATAVTGSTSDHDLTSFDGTKIRFHWFPPS
jgi:hypothetical protein